VALQPTSVLQMAPPDAGALLGALAAELTPPT
jgi:hypothetical protein